jgi:bacterioferritin-associated ferredoxin
MIFRDGTPVARKLSKRKIMNIEVKSTCCYCGVGCGAVVATEGGRITGVSGDPEHPANFGRLCSTPPVSIAPRNIVGNCADVSDQKIKAEIAQGADLPTLQQNLKCGTFYGFWVPDIKRMLVERKVNETVPI